MKVGEAKELTGGGLGHPSKMPGTSYGISAHACITGSKLASVPGSVCHGCYALKGNYKYNSVQVAHKRRLASIAGPHWTAALVFLLNKEYAIACREYIDLLRNQLPKRGKLARLIKQSLSKPIGSQSRIRAAGFGLARRTKTGMGIIQRPAVLNPAMYPLTLPVSGAIVALSPSGKSRTTFAALDHALIRNICNYLLKLPIDGYTQTSDETQLPEGLQLTYFM